MPKGLPAAKPSRPCDVCGQPTRSTYGVCDQRSGKCHAEYERRRREAGLGTLRAERPSYRCLGCGELRRAASGAPRYHVCCRTLACRRLERHLHGVIEGLAA